MNIEEDYVDIWRGRQRKRFTMVRSQRILHGRPGIKGFIEENGTPNEEHLDLMMEIRDPIELTWNELQGWTHGRPTYRAERTGTPESSHLRMWLDDI